jgi:glutathione synthase
MSLQLVFVMDPIDRVNIDADSTFAIMREAQRRGHDLLYCESADLELEMDRAHARVRPLTVRQERGNHYLLGEPSRVALDEVNAVFMRKDPPFDVEYVMSTYILDRIDRGRVVLVNDPQGIRDSNEKLFALHFPELLPRTIVARHPRTIRAFIESEGDVVVKPLTGAGGAGVIQLRRGDVNTSAVLELLTQEGRVAIMAQRFLPRVTEGDRRVILIDGQAVGVINRRPKAGELRSNMHVGGTAEPAALTPRDREICDRIGPELRARGLVFVGIDIIDGHLTEINVTSPTGIQEIDRFDGGSIAGTLLDWVEAKSLLLQPPSSQ